MTNPTVPEPDAASSDSVQGWEQKVQRPGQPSRLEPLQSRHETPEQETEAESGRPGGPLSHSFNDDADAPMPPVVPRYLRADGRARATPAAAAAPAFDARRETLTAQTAAVVDAITQGLAQALAISLRPVVASTIVTLVPMLLSLGSVPDPLDTQPAGRVQRAFPMDGDEQAVDGEAS